MFMRTVSAAAIAAAIALPSAALAQSASVTTDLNMRAGPGPNFEVTTVINNSDKIDVLGCTDTGNWCKVSYGGQEGWAYANYITYDIDGKVVVLPEARTAATVQVPTVTYEGSGAVTGAAGGAITGALIGGPVGAAIGAGAGLAAGAVLDPPSKVQTFVVNNKHDYVYLDGEVVVGARLPDTVQMYSIPDYEYQYAYINGVRVLIDPNTRAIVHVYR